MDRKSELNPLTLQPGQALLVEGARGAARRAAIDALAERLRAQPEVDVTVLRCDFDEGGPWAGIRDLLLEIHPTLQQSAPSLVTLHDYELALAVPSLRRQIKVRNPCLTDTSTGDEEVRNYAMDRALRVVHGLVDLLASWRAQCAPGRSWVLVCEDLDRAGALVRRLTAELLRRKGAAIGVRLVAVVAPGRLAPELSSHVAASVPLDVAGETTPPIDGATARAAAEALQAELQRDQLALEERLPELIALWTASDTPERARRWNAWALGVCNHNGLYADALRYGEEVIEHLDLVAEGSEEVRWNVIGNLFHALVATGATERARRLIEDEALAKLQTPVLRFKARYVMAMLHARYLPERDFAAAERLLVEAIDGLEALDLPDDQKHFQAVFFSNGLAFVKQRQGHPDEAIALCNAGTERLNRYLAPNRHRLHRSVLLFNIAQVLSAARSYEKAIAYLSAAMDIDPNYSEYYNDRGNAYLRLGLYDQALVDYQRAILLSPPYVEVQSNLGQCLRLLGRTAEAELAYSTALDLDPDNRLAREGRAQVHDLLGRTADAIADYGELLRLDPNQPLVLANRAALSYESGHVDAALDDLDRAIALAPERAELYYNRAFAREGGGRGAEAAHDLRQFLSLVPDCSERPAIEARLTTLEAAHAG